MKIFEILYHSVIFKMMFLIMKFCQDFKDQYEQNYQTLHSVDITVIKEAVCNSE